MRSPEMTTDEYQKRVMEGVGSLLKELNTTSANYEMDVVFHSAATLMVMAAWQMARSDAAKAKEMIEKEIPLMHSMIKRYREEWVMGHA